MTASNGRGCRTAAIDPVRVDRLLAAMRTGVNIETSAQFAGIPRQTLFDWLRKGRAGVGGRNGAAYKEFVEQVDEATAQFEVQALARIARAGEDAWQADAWRLERKFPEKYGRRTRIDADVTVSATPFVDLTKLTADERNTLAGLLAKAAPQQEQLPAAGRPALELIAGSGDVIEGEATEIA